MVRNLPSALAHTVIAFECVTYNIRSGYTVGEAVRWEKINTAHEADTHPSSDER